MTHLGQNAIVSNERDKNKHFVPAQFYFLNLLDSMETSSPAPVETRILSKAPFFEMTQSSSAARGGNLDVLQYARANGCPWNASTCSNAASNGHTDIIRWARDNGCPWNAKTCFNAARNNRLKVVRWLHANGCPWDARTYKIAVKNKNYEMIKYIVEHGCPEK
jgi:hypothetical protein